MSFKRIKKGFTLLEVIIVMVVFFMLITTITSLFITLYKIKGGLEGRQTVSQDTYFLIEKLQTMMKDYTIDYEEYWNRSQVGCTEIGNPEWSGSSYCTIPSYYGNQSMVGTEIISPLFYCSSINENLEGEYLTFDAGIDFDPIQCINNVSTYKYGSTGPDSFAYQGYGQYKNLFTDVKDDVDYATGAAKDDDDDDKGNGLEAIYHTETNNPQELYLISHDKQRRMLIRRNCKEQIDIDNNSIVTPSEQLCTLQVLQLRGFDAGYTHNFDVLNSKGVYDGVIDTWACDYSVGFQCQGDSIKGAFSNYQLPKDGDDGWQDLLANNITITDWNLRLYPTKNSLLARDDNSSQQSQYVIISLTAQLYAKNRQRKLTLDQMNAFNLPIQTQFSLGLQ